MLGVFAFSMVASPALASNGVQTSGSAAIVEPASMHVVNDPRPQVLLLLSGALTPPGIVFTADPAGAGAVGMLGLESGTKGGDPRLVTGTTQDGATLSVSIGGADGSGISAVVAQYN
jgi:hypothetical protein